MSITPDSARENIPEGSFMITAEFPVGVTRTTNTMVPFRARGIGENPAAINHDYSHREGFSIVILANSPSGTIPSGGSPFVFVLVNDAISEPDETVEFYSPNPPVGFTVTPATLTIEDDDASTNADLLSLSLTDPDAGGAAIPLAETFNAAVGTYTATVVNSVTNVTVTPTVDSGATTVLLVGSSPVTNPIALSVGDTAITVRVTAEDTATIKNYLITVTRAAPVNVPATGVPTIAGTASSGETLTAVTTDIMDDNGLGTFSYLWQQGTDDGADGGYINIASATTETLVLTDAQVGRRILVIVSFTDNDGNAETVTSVATAAVAAVALQGPRVTSVTATAGTYRLGEVVAITVTFNEETIVDGPGPSLSMSTGGTATYLPGSSGPTTLAFGYTVRSNDDTDAFSYAGTAALTLNVGGEILNFAEDADAILTLPTPVAFADVIVDGIAPPAPTFVPSPTFVKVNTPLGGVTEDGTTVILCLVGGGGDPCGPSGEGRMARTHDVGGLALIAFETTWSYTLTQADITAMGEGLETLIAIATDVAGNTAEGAVEVTVDTTAPAIPTFTDPTAVAGDDNIINADEGATGLTLTGGTAADVDAVHICFNGTPDFAPTGSPGCDGGGTRTAAQDTDTTWSYDLSAIRITEFLGSGVLTEGSTSTMIIIATDAAGNRAMSASVTISTDTILPTVTADITSVTETDSGATVTSGGTTAATSLTLSGMGDTTDLMVNIHDGTDLLGSVMAAADGGWSYTDASLTPGTTRNYTAAVADTAGNEGPASGIFTITSTAAVVPIVTSVAAPNGSYKAGDLVPITVTFSEAVTVGIAGGVPELALTTDNSGGTGVATYTAGTDTDELTFTYTVRTGDNIGEFRDDAEFTSEFPDTTFAAGTYLNDLAYTSATALTRNGGTIQMIAPTLDANLTLPMPGALNSLSHSSNVVLDNLAPMVRSATVTLGGANIEVVLSEVLTPASLDFLDIAEFTLDGTTAVVREVVTNPNRAVLILVLTDPDDPTLAIIQPNETVLLSWASSDSITDTAGNVLDDFTNVSVTNEEEMPMVALVTPADFAQYHKAGDDVHIVVTFTTSVTVTGTPQLTLDVDGTEGSAVSTAMYVAGSPGADLTFRYTVADGHNTAALAYSSVSALTQGVSIQRTPTATATDALAADLTLPEPGAPNSLSGNFFGPVVIDTTAPAVPTIDTVAGDNRITAAERNADVGVEITGSRDADVNTTITLCFGATDPTDPLCAGGRTYDSIVPVPILSEVGGVASLVVADADIWSYLLDVVEITEIAGINSGAVTLTAIATDAAGNTAVSTGIPISVDALEPPGIAPVTGDNLINATERTNGITVTGTHDAALTVMLCVGGTYNPIPLPKFFIPAPPRPSEVPAVVPFNVKEFLDSLPGRLCEGGTTYAAEGGLGTIFDGESVPVSTDKGVTEVPITGIVGMPVGRAWSAELDTAAITAAGEGSVPLTAIAFDTLGGVTVSPVIDVTVDVVPPTADTTASAIAGGTNIVVTVSEPLVLTNLGSLDGTEFTVGGTTAATAVTAVSTDGTALRLSLDTAIQSGETVTIQWHAPTGDIIADTAGNVLVAFAGVTVTIIDDITPAIDPVAGDNTIKLAERNAGVTITGTRVRDTTVTLCLRVSADVCIADAERAMIGDTPTTWRYALTDDDYDLMGQNDVTLRATATVEGLSVTINHDIVVDTIAPGVPTVNDPAVDSTSGNTNIIIGDNANGLCSRVPATATTPERTRCTVEGEDGLRNIDGERSNFGPQPIIFDGVLDDTKGRAPGIVIRGTYTAPVTSLIICAGATDAADPTCAGGVTFGSTSRAMATLYME